MAVHHLVLTPDIAGIARLIDWVERSCGEEGVTGGISGRLALAVEEAVVNVINHAFFDQPPPHRIEVRLDISSDRIVAEVVDNGRPFDPTAAPAPDVTLPVEERDPGGLGILLIHRMVDRVAYQREGGRNRLRLEKARG